MGRLPWFAPFFFRARRLFPRFDIPTISLFRDITGAGQSRAGSDSSARPLSTRPGPRPGPACPWRGRRRRTGCGPPRPRPRPAAGGAAPPRPPPSARRRGRRR
ncbi:hypothetical protein EAO77_12925 [Streptomyces sp. t39]|nr:hypothetical protein EAO77_12925 [Streptomyces sp. t39]